MESPENPAKPFAKVSNIREAFDPANTIFFNLQMRIIDYIHELFIVHERVSFYWV